MLDTYLKRRPNDGNYILLKAFILSLNNENNGKLKHNIDILGFLIQKARKTSKNPKLDYINVRVI